MLRDEIQKAMLQAAREAAAHRVCPGSPPAQTDLSAYPQLHEYRGAFVTLKQRNTGALRGCIGNMIGREPLFAAVPRLAVEAAVSDFRFEPVTCDELKQLTFEISVLTPLKPVDSYEDIVIGTDGIVLSCHGRHAVFLPQVAVEQQWTREQTLSHLAMKAGLAPDSWMKPACSFEVFQSQVFSEE